MSKTRIPPQSVDSERALLACMLQDRVACEQSLSMLSPESLYLDRHQIIFEAMKQLKSKNIICDMITVIDELGKMKRLEEVGGAIEISNIYNRTTTHINYEHYANIVLDKYIKRRVIQESNELIEKAYNDMDNIIEDVDSMQAGLSSLMSSDATVYSSQDLMENLFSNNSKPLPSGFTKFDSVYSGYWKSDLIILAGRPSSGKTAFALSTMLSMSKQGIPCSLISMEMSENQVAMRFASMESGVEHDKIRNRNLTQTEQLMVDEARRNIASYPFYVDSRSGLDVYKMKTFARRQHLAGKCDVLFIDYLQIADKGNKENNTIATGIVTTQLKALAKELDIPIILLSQLSRKSEERSNHRPMLSDLRDSGQIEQDADMVMFVHRPFVYSQDLTEEDKAIIIIAKNRNGKTGDLSKWRFDADIVRFSETNEYFA